MTHVSICIRRTKGFDILVYPYAYVPPPPPTVLTSVQAPYAHDYLAQYCGPRYAHACVTCEDRALLILYLNLVPRATWKGIALGTRLPLVYQSYQKSPISLNLDEILSLSVFPYLCTPFAYDKSLFSHYCHFVFYPHFSTVYLLVFIIRLMKSITPCHVAITK